MSPFYEIVSKTGKLATINLNYVIRFEPHGPNTDIWIGSGDTGGDVYYLAVVEYEQFKQAVNRILTQ